MAGSCDLYRPGIGPTLTPQSLGIPGERERYRMRKRVIAGKLNGTLLPAMRKHNIDMWIVLSREFHPDPLLPDLGGDWAGVRSAYIFFDRGGDVPEKVFIGSHRQDEDLIDSVYDQVIYYSYNQEGLAPYLREAVHSRDPQRIGINVSKTLPMADGLSVALKDFLVESIGPVYAERLVTAELVARDFRATRIPDEVGPYRRLCQWTVDWEEEAFSERVVWPGVTTTEDIAWWMRGKARELGLGVEFLPGVRATRLGEGVPRDRPVLPGDVLTVDAGLAFEQFRTDYKRTAYVLRPGETEPPQSLQDGLQEALQMRDKIAASMVPGTIAHVVWDNIMEWAQAQGYSIAYPAASGKREVVSAKQVGIYCHAVGNATHGIGARIAVDWPMAYGDRVRYPLALTEWYSIEFHVSVPIPEWDGRAMSYSIEETVALTENGAQYLAPTLDRLLLIAS